MLCKLCDMSVYQCLYVIVNQVLIYYFILLGSDSWASGNWKDGLSSVAMKNISQLETHAEKLKREKEQKQFQLESLEQVMI